VSADEAAGARVPADCADGRCISIKALAVQIWGFCAFAPPVAGT
jgi:hypothetical protein